MVFTPPQASADFPYKLAKKAAKAVILDEAGAMCKADALLVLGNVSRPWAMAGDDKQPCAGSFGPDGKG